MTSCTVQPRLILIWSDLLTPLKPTLIATISFLFKSVSTSLIWTRIFMVRLTSLPSIIEEVGTEFVNPTGTSSNPIVTFFTTLFRVLMCQLTRFTLMPAPTLPSFVPLYLVTSSHPHNATFIPHVNSFTINKRSLVPLPPHFFSFFYHSYGPLRGVTSGISATQWRLSIHIPRFILGLVEILFCVILSSLCLADLTRRTSSTIFWVA